MDAVPAMPGTNATGFPLDGDHAHIDRLSILRELGWQWARLKLH